LAMEIDLIDLAIQVWEKSAGIRMGHVEIDKKSLLQG